jgi:trk system potassium uptake protein TrkA
MYVIVVGGGKVGYYLSRTLLSEGHEVTLIEKDPARERAQPFTTAGKLDSG